MVTKDIMLTMTMMMAATMSVVIYIKMALSTEDPAWCLDKLCFIWHAVVEYSNDAHMFVFRESIKILRKISHQGIMKYVVLCSNEDLSDRCIPSSKTVYLKT